LEGEDQISAYAPVPGYGWGVVTQQPTRASLGLEARDDQLRLLLTAYGLVLLLCVSGIYLASRIALERRRAEEDRRIKAELERRVAERTAQLEAANKELESFSYSVSHDLRSPLRAIDGFSRILQEDYAGKLDDESRRLLGVIRDNSQKMGRLIDDLLEYSRLGRKPLSTVEIDMKRLVEEVLGELQVSGEKPPRLVLGALPPARGDAMLVKQAWANLMGNAIKFSSKRERPVIEVSGREDGAESVYCVKDNGAGFDMQYYDKLFGVFQRLHSAEEFSGTGVGLAIVQRVVTRHGGRLWAEGKVNEGATFYFALPKGGSA
jgi:light-regulated signal transduction histidine kinase (bacteriophytochrome)